MPSNIYLSGSLSLSFSEIDLKNEGVANKTDPGTGIYLSIGKEWWISENWGMGIAGFIYGNSATINTEKNKVNNTVYGLVFSATYQ